MTIRPFLRAFGVALACAFGCVAASACGGADPAPASTASATTNVSTAASEQQRDIEYTKRCYSRSAEQEQAVKTGRYTPPTLLLHQWPKDDLGRPVGSRIKEADFAKQIGRGRIKHGLVIARGGAGKTSLAKALEVQLCGDMHTFLAHLQWDVADAAPGKGNPILARMATQLGAPAGMDPIAYLKAHVGKQRPWIVLLDALDEVAIDRRKQVVGWVNELPSALPGLRTVVFSRPPVFDAVFGLQGLDAMVEIPPLTCAAVDRAMVSGAGGAVAGLKFKEFIKRYHFDRQVRDGGECYYAQMSTWRDLSALRHISRLQSDPALAKRLNSGGIDGRAAMFEAYLTTLLQDDVQGTTQTPHDVLGVVDAVVKAKRDDNLRALTITLADCMLVALGNQSEKQARCETLLQSAVFRATTRPKTWRLANQTLADLFLARKIHAELPADGSDCKQLRTRAALFESSEIGGFLVGMSRGRQCIAEITGILCTRSKYEPQQLSELARNVPPGVEGHVFVKKALARAEQDARTERCALDVLRRLEVLMRPQTASIGR